MTSETKKLRTLESIGDELQANTYRTISCPESTYAWDKLCEELNEILWLTDISQGILEQCSIRFAEQPNAKHWSELFAAMAYHQWLSN